jgi:hypothetical protein
MVVLLTKEGIAMENTHEFVEKLHATQEKQEKNKEHQGKGSPEKQLSNKRHSTNK